MQPLLDAHGRQDSAYADLVVIDTPPTRPTRLQMALGVTRWVVVPTKSYRASIEGLQTLAQQNPSLGILGAVLFDSGSSATAVRRDANEDIAAALGNLAQPFTTTIRHAESTAVRLREQGQLAHELAAQAESAEPFWQALRDGRRPDRIPGSAGALAEDYVLLTQELLARIAESEITEEDQPA